MTSQIRYASHSKLTSLTNRFLNKSDSKCGKLKCVALFEKNINKELAISQMLKFNFVVNAIFDKFLLKFYSCKKKSNLSFLIQ